MAAYDQTAILSELSGSDCHIAPLSPVSARENAAPKDSTTCSHLIPLEHKFLVLAPVTFSSYAVQQPTSLTTSLAPAPVASSTVTSKALQAFQVEAVAKERRSSSVSSSASAKFRFLKLGPVHYGGEPGQLDYVDVAEE